MGMLTKSLINIFKRKEQNTNYSENNKNSDYQTSCKNFINYKTHLGLLDNFVVFDLETTGLNPGENKIIQIGAIRYRDNQNVDVFNAYVNPEIKIPSKITKITGITNDNVKNAPNIKKVIPQFLNFIGNDVLVAHNANFDMNFLLTNIYNLKIDKPQNEVIDTLMLARKYIRDKQGKKLDSYKLENLKKLLNIDVGSHNSVDDCLVCGEVYKKCKENIKILKSNKAIKNDEIGNLENECFEIIKEILKRNNKDIECLRYVYVGKFFDIQAFYSLVRIKLRGKKQYILSKYIKKEIKEVWKDAICEKAVKSETGITRILINHPNELFKLEKLIIHKFDECMNGIEIYRKNVKCGERNIQEYLNS